MKIRLAAVPMIAMCGFGVWLWCGAAPGAAAEGVHHPAAAASLAVFTADDEAKYSYVGSQKCKKCHLTQHKSWAKTKMGQTFETLKPGKAADVKAKFGLDPEKDYTKDSGCLKCHATGYGKPDGYAPPADPNDRRAAKKAQSLEGVGCESCHGPGSEYIKVFEEIDKSQRAYTLEELTAVGLRLPTKDVCLECHNADSPTVDPTVEFDFEGTKEKSTHDHKALKLREG